MKEVLKDINHLSTKELLEVLIAYLAVLQDGRAKPDTKGNGGYIRECVYNIEEIEEVKSRINNILRIKQLPKNIEFEDKTNNYYKKY